MLDYTFMQHALLISICIAILCPCIGIFLVLKRYSMIGDTLAHASLAGVTLGLFSGQVQLFLLLFLPLLPVSLLNFSVSISENIRI